jgi:hypothetical protein
MNRAVRALAVLIGVVVLAGMTTLPAVAKVSVDKELAGAYNACVAKFRAAGLGAVVDQLNNSRHGFTIDPTSKPLGSIDNPYNRIDSRDGTGTGGTMDWNPTDTTPFPGPSPGDAVAQDPCATLYHELNHLAQYDTGNSRDDVNCNSLSKVHMTEVLATRAENQYRMTQGLKDREYYGYDELPPPGSPCTPPPYQRPSGGCNGGCSVSACGVGCAISNGDPHLTTFDQVRYDFQAVGEFIDVRSASGDLEVQTRQTAFEDSRTVSVITAVAAKVGATRVGVYMTPAGLSFIRTASRPPFQRCPLRHASRTG